MTATEKLMALTAVAQSFATMNRTNAVRIETYRHKAMAASDRLADGMEWLEGEWCWEVSFYCGDSSRSGPSRFTNPSGVGKSLEQAIDLCAAAGAEAMKWIAQVERDREKDRIDRSARYESLAQSLLAKGAHYAP